MLENNQGSIKVASMANTSEVTVFDGSVNFSGGVDSVKLPTIASSDNPNGLSRNELAWLCNGTVRDGGITQRATWQPTGIKLADASGLWQSAAIYVPDDAFPYLLYSTRGKIYMADPDGSNPVLLSTTAALSNPPNLPYGYMVQGEQFMIIQAGDNVTLPLFWDGSTLRRSNGPSVNLGNTTVNFTAPAVNHRALVGPSGITVNYKGVQNQVFEINGDTGAKYMQVNANQVLQLQNIGANVTGIIDAGSEIISATGAVVGKLLTPFTIPPLAGPNNDTFLEVPYPGTVGDQVTIQGQQFQVAVIGAAAPGAGNIWAVNLNQTAGTVNTAPVSLVSIQEIGAASAMDYYEGRLWYAIGRNYLAGDIVQGPSGTAFYNFRDSILKVTENPLCLAGDGFIVPDNAGNIRSLFHNANLNTTLGQGNLYIGTAKAIYSLDVPVTRTDWIAADVNKQPKQTVVQLANGTVNDRSCTLINGDVWYQTLEPSIASLFTQVRNFSQWGNISLSANENRILQFNDRALLHFASGTYFNNRMLQTSLPRQLPQGVVHDALIPLDFVPMSQFGAALTPNWEGHHEGLQWLQLFVANFGGRERCFAAVVSQAPETLGEIHLWELSTAGQFENGDKRVSWYAEFPSFTAGDIFQLKNLVCAELSVDRLYGTVEFQMDYRPDNDSCWHLWHKWQLCSARNSNETVDEPISYPVIQFCEGYRQTFKLPKPQLKCQTQSKRPLNQGYAFQVRLKVHGFCRIRALRLYMTETEEPLYHNIICP